MMQVSVIVELLEVGPHGPGRGAIGATKVRVADLLHVERLVLDRAVVKAFHLALERRREFVDEAAKIAREQKKLF
jgi:hypothetical protein